MTRLEYMKHIKSCLKRLPKQDLEQALEYFHEYFEEAGPEQEARAIEDLGDPKAAAEQILRNLAITNARETKGNNIKRSAASVWVGILAICAAPIALPLVLLIALTVILVVLTVLTAIGSLLFIGVILTVLSPVLLLSGVYLLFTYPASGAVTIGCGLAVLGFGILICFISIKMGKLFLNGMTKLLGLCVKGGRHEKTL